MLWIVYQKLQQSKVNPLNDGWKATAWPHILYTTLHWDTEGYFNIENDTRMSETRTYDVKNSYIAEMICSRCSTTNLCYLSEWYWSLAEMASGSRKKLEEQNHDTATTEIAFYGENRLQPKIALMWSRVVYFTVNKGKTKRITAIQLLSFGIKWQTLQ